MAKNFRHVVTVHGDGPFPIDMLRYDRLIPDSEDDSGEIFMSFGRKPKNKRIKLYHMDEKKWEPTVGRWESFAWKVLNHEVFAY